MSDKQYKMVDGNLVELSKGDIAQRAKDAEVAKAEQQARADRAKDIDARVAKSDLKVLIADLLKAQAGLIKGIDY